MSSSNRGPTHCEAAVHRDEKPVGPIRLPMKEKASFVEEFNRVYQGTGITIYRGTDEVAEESEAIAVSLDSSRNPNRKR